MTHQHTPLRPLATVQAWQAQLEADGGNPKLTEPLTIGPRVPPETYVRRYTWTAVKMLAPYDDEGNPIPILNPPSAALVMPALQSGHGSGWAQAQITTLEPGLIPKDFDTTAVVAYTDPMPMAEGIALADQIDASGGPPRNDVTRIPRPYYGEQPTENDASAIVLGIADDSMKNKFPVGTHWNTYLPQVERAHFPGIQYAIYGRADGRNVIDIDGQHVDSVACVIPDAMRAFPDQGDFVIAAPSNSYRPRLTKPAVALDISPPQHLVQLASPLADLLDGANVATIYCVVKFAQMTATETAWSIGAGPDDFWSLSWEAGDLVARRHSDDEVRAPFTAPDFSVIAMRSNGAGAADLFIDGDKWGSPTVGQSTSALVGGVACLGALRHPDEVAGASMYGEIAEWTTCLVAHSDQEVDTVSAYLRAYWESRGLTFNPLPPLE